MELKLECAQCGFMVTMKIIIITYMDGADMQKKELNSVAQGSSRRMEYRM